MALIETRIAKNRCILCSNDVEKSNIGSMCNPCKDKVYRFDFMTPKKIEINKKADARKKQGESRT